MYPGVPRNTERWDNLYNHRVYIERTIFLLIDCFVAYFLLILQSSILLYSIIEGIFFTDFFYTLNMKKIANILWKRDIHFLSTRIKNLICMTKTYLKMVGLSVI